MSNKQKYNEVFIKTFSLEEDKLASNPAYNEIPLWDSIGHMTMVSALEETFNIVMETDDIIGFNCYQKGFEILTKYGITLE